MWILIEKEFFLQGFVLTEEGRVLLLQIKILCKNSLNETFQLRDTVLRILVYPWNLNSSEM